MKVAASHVMMQIYLQHEENEYKCISEPFHTSNTNREEMANTMGSLMSPIDKRDDQSC